MDNGNITDNKENTVEQVRITADTAEAEKSDKAATEFGKFKSAEALLSAYLSLEAEFTRRSQRLKELEERSKAQSVSEDSGAPSCESQNKNALLDTVLADETIKSAVIGEYLKGVTQAKSIPLIVGGVSASAPHCGPKTVKDAGALAERFLKS